MKTIASEIIPQGEVRQLLFGGSDPAVLKRIFGKLPQGKPYQNDDRRRAQTVVMLDELHEIYYRTAIHDGRLHDGYCEGMRQFRRLVVHNPFDKALAEAQALIDDRLSVVEHIEAVFFTHSFLERDKQVRIDQLGRPVSEGEAFVFAIRVGLKYVISRAKALTEAAPTDVPDAYMDVPPVWRALAYHDQQRDFVKHVLPKLRDKYEDRPGSHVSDICVHGYSAVADLILRVSHILRTKPRSQMNFNEEYNGKYQRILDNPLLRRLFVEQVRESGYNFHLLRLGWGHPKCRPSAKNKIFDYTVPADQVPISDLEEVFNHHQNLKGKDTNWWVQKGVKGAVRPQDIPQVQKEKA